MADGSSWKRWIRFHDDNPTDDDFVWLLWWWNDVSRWRWVHSSSTIKPPAILGTSRHDPTESSFSFCKRIRLSVPYTWVTHTQHFLLASAVSTFHGRPFFSFDLLTIRRPWRQATKKKSLYYPLNATTQTMAGMENSETKAAYYLLIPTEIWVKWRDHLTWLNGWESRTLSNHERDDIKKTQTNSHTDI
jgi:hypothetical protein